LQKKFFEARRNRVEVKKTIQEKSKENVLKMLFNLIVVFCYLGWWLSFVGFCDGCVGICIKIGSWVCSRSKVLIKV
jgi:hypothetical protein